MDIFHVLALFGGIALFLYGMNAMGDGLEKFSSGKLEKILERLTSNPVKSVLLGLVVTAIIQSSAATIVMVVGFVNSGIMTLAQTVPIMMGANIGTTVTAWLISLNNISGAGFFMKLLEPSSFTPILAMIGIAFLMFSKNGRRKDLGTIFLGFTVLMTGISMMTESMEPLADDPGFQSLFLQFSNPVLGMLLGAGLTALIQSSSASVGILQALSVSGTVTMGSAIPIILGMNIGTCITSMLSSIGTSKDARRTALTNLYFKVVGTVLFMIVFYGLNSILNFSFLKSLANPVTIAIFHTVFNILSTVVLLPFCDGLVKLACLTIKDSPEEERGSVLDPRLLDTPSMAIWASKNVADNMAQVAKDSIVRAFELLADYSEEGFDQVSAMEEEVDKYEDLLGTYLVKLSSKNVTQKESGQLSLLLHSINDFERISDHAVNIAESAQEMFEKQVSFSEEGRKDLDIICRAINEIVDRAVSVFKREDTRGATNVEPLEEVVDILQVELKNRHVERVRQGKCTIEMGYIFNDLVTDFERVADHCSNIAVCVIQSAHVGYETHEYIEMLKRTDDEHFKKMFREFEFKYRLP